MRIASSRAGVVALLIVAALAILYAYRAQTPVASSTPAVPTASVSEAIEEIRSGRVKTITFDGSVATVELADGTRQQMAIGGTEDRVAIGAAGAEYNRTNPTRPVSMQQVIDHVGEDSNALLLFFLLSVVLFGGLTVLAVSSSRRADDRYARSAHDPFRP